MNTDPRRWKALALLCVASFMVILDASIVTTAVPSIQAELGFAGGGVQWVMTAYIVTFGGLLACRTGRIEVTPVVAAD